MANITLTRLTEEEEMTLSFMENLKRQGVSINNFSEAVVFLICVLFFDWRLGLIELVGMIVYMLITSSMEKKSRALSPVRQRNEAALVALFPAAPSFSFPRVPRKMKQICSLRGKLKNCRSVFK